MNHICKEIPSTDDARDFVFEKNRGGWVMKIYKCGEFKVVACPFCGERLGKST